jgi:3-hydroxybutyryl-CoA dehydrogenase
VTDIKKVGVVGAGLMGHGIAQVSAEAGYDVVLLDADQGALDRGLAAVGALLDRAVDKGRTTAEDAAAVRARIQGTTDSQDLAPCDMVIEAIIERLDAKLELWRALDPIVQPSAVFASNTSSLSIIEQAAATERPDRVIGLHFFNPVQVMGLVEVVRTIAAADEAVAAGAGYVTRIGKLPVETRDRAGFLVNRILVPFMLDAVRAFEEGVGTIEAIDAGFRLGAGHPMGPLTLNDFVGLETLSRAAEGMYDEYRDPRFATPPLLRKMITAGWYGKKTGLGFYDWSGPEPVPNPKIDLLRTV